MTDYLHETGELRCPRCDVMLVGDFGQVETSSDVENELVRARFACPDCGAPLDVVIESALPDALGVDVHVEEVGE